MNDHRIVRVFDKTFQFVQDESGTITITHIKGPPRISPELVKIEKSKEVIREIAKRAKATSRTPAKTPAKVFRRRSE